MQIDPTQADRILAMLRFTHPYQQLPVTNRPQITLWKAIDEANHAVRLPLYHKRLGKRAPNPTLVTAALQQCLALLAAFAAVHQTHRTIVSTSDGWMDTISFQPRPFAMNWTAEHAIAPPDLVGGVYQHMAFEVVLEDFFSLAAKATCLLLHEPPGELSDATATFSFEPHWLDDESFVPRVEAVARTLDGRVKRTWLHL